MPRATSSRNAFTRAAVVAAWFFDASKLALMQDRDDYSGMGGDSRPERGNVECRIWGELKFAWMGKDGQDGEGIDAAGARRRERSRYVERDLRSPPGSCLLAPAIPASDSHFFNR